MCVCWGFKMTGSVREHASTEVRDRRTISNEITELTDNLRRRARRALFEARFYLICSVVVGIGLVYYFTTFGGIFAKYGSIAIGGSVTGSIDLKVEPGTFTSSTEWDTIISQVVTRLGAVFIAIFIMQALISFSRYKLGFQITWQGRPTFVRALEATSKICKSYRKYI